MGAPAAAGDPRLCLRPGDADASDRIRACDSLLASNQRLTQAEFAAVNLALGDAFLDDDRPQAAIDPLIRATALEPNNPRAFALLARAQLESGAFEQSQRSAERAVALNPDAPEAKFALGEAAFRRRDYATARRMFEEIVRGSGFGEQAPKRLIGAAAARLGEIALAENDLEGALDSLKSALARSPESPAILLGLGDINLRLAAQAGERSGDANGERPLSAVEAGYYNDAVSAYSLVINGQKSNLDERARAYLGRGRAFSALKLTADALADLRSAAASDPSSAEPPRELARALAIAGDRAPAIDAYRDAIRLNPRDATLYLELGDLYLQADQIDLAKDAYLTADRLAPGQGRTAYSLGLADARGWYREPQSGDLRRAREHLERAVALFEQQNTTGGDRYAPLAYYNLSRVNGQLGDLSAAIRNADQAVRLQPRTEEFWRQACRVRVLAADPIRIQPTQYCERLELTSQENALVRGIYYLRRAQLAGLSTDRSRNLDLASQAFVAGQRLPATEKTIEGQLNASALLAYGLSMAQSCAGLRGLADASRQGVAQRTTDARGYFDSYGVATCRRQS